MLFLICSAVVVAITDIDTPVLMKVVPRFSFVCVVLRCGVTSQVSTLSSATSCCFCIACTYVATVADGVSLTAPVCNCTHFEVCTYVVIYFLFIYSLVSLGYCRRYRAFCFDVVLVAVASVAFHAGDS